MFTKADLKNGMVVEIRKGDRYIVFENILMNERNYLKLKDYEENLSFASWQSKLDIVKVWDIKGLLGLNGCLKKPDARPYDVSLLYEEKPKEMTLEEIETELGYKVKVVTKNE